MKARDRLDALLSRFGEIASDPYSRLRRWKAATGGQVAGCLPMYVPEELVHAAGVLPVVLCASKRSTPLADARIPNFVCSLVRSSLDDALRGTFDFCDGFVFPYVCDSSQGLFEVWKKNCAAPFFHHLVLPARQDTAAARTYYLEELKRFKAALEDWTGRVISDEALRQSIDVYNRNRRLLQRLYCFRRDAPGIMTGRQMLSVLRASFTMPKEEHSRLLAELLDVLEDQPCFEGGKLRVVLTGILAQDAGLMDTIEECGAVVADDDLYDGARYFSGMAPTDLQPLDSLSSRFFEMMPCSTKHDPARPWAAHVVSMARRVQADGVIMLLMKYCDSLAFDYPDLKDRLEGAGIRHLLIETDQSDGGSARLRTRVEAFLETLRDI